MEGYAFLRDYMVVIMLSTFVILVIIVLYNSLKLDKSQKHEDLNTKVNRKLDGIIERKGFGSVLFYFGIAIVLSIFAFPMGVFLAEYFQFWPTEEYGQVTNATGTPEVLLWILVPFTLIIWVLMLSLIYVGMANLVRLLFGRK